MATGGVGDIFGGAGSAISSLFGSNAAPKAYLNRFAAPTAKLLGQFGGPLLGDVGRLSGQAIDTYLGLQPKQMALAGQQEGILNTLLGRRMAADPNQLLRDVGQTAFGFIDPNVINPLSQFDVNSNTLMRRARGLNPAAVDSSAERLRNARVASTRYYDVARDAYQALPNLYGQAFNQGIANDASAAGLVPQIAAAYEGVAARPWNAVNQRISSAGGAANAANQAIQGVLAATQGYKQPQNWADRIGAASQGIGQSVGGIASLAGLGGGGGGSPL